MDYVIVIGGVWFCIWASKFLMPGRPLGVNERMQVQIGTSFRDTVFNAWQQCPRCDRFGVHYIKRVRKHYLKRECSVCQHVWKQDK